MGHIWGKKLAQTHSNTQKVMIQLALMLCFLPDYSLHTHNYIFLTFKLWISSFIGLNVLKQKGITRLLKSYGALMGQTHSILSSEALPEHRYFLTSIFRKPGKPSAHQRDPFAKQ